MPGYLRPETEVKIRPSSTYTDPVSKLRVSTPQTLIDTDFEYGLQSTKWETINRVNHFPSFFSRTQDTPLTNITNLAATGAGSKNITVTLSIPHGLATGTPVQITGLLNPNAEGNYIIKTITATTFTYVCAGAIPNTNSLLTPYTTVIPGEFYVGSEVGIHAGVGITTDGATPSTITFNTISPHGFQVDDEFYLVNSNAGRTLTFDGSANYEGGTGSVDDRATIAIGAGAALRKTVVGAVSASTTIALNDVSGLYVGSNLYGPAASAVNTKIATINAASNTITVSAAQTIANGASVYFVPPLNPTNAATTVTATTTNSNTVTVAALDGIVVGATVQGTGTFPSNTTVTGINATTSVITLSGNVTIASGAAIRFYILDPSVSTFAYNKGQAHIFAYEGRVRSNNAALYFNDSDINIATDTITTPTHGFNLNKVTLTGASTAISATSITFAANQSALSASSATWGIGATSLTLAASNANITVGMYVYGTNIPPFTKVASSYVGGTTVPLEFGPGQSITAAGSAAGVVFTNLHKGMTFNIANSVADNFISSFTTNGTSPNYFPTINTSGTFSATVANSNVSMIVWNPIALQFHMGVSGSNGNVVPGGMAVNTRYYVVNVPSSTSIQIATSANGGAGATYAVLDITSVGASTATPFHFVPLQATLSGTGTNQGDAVRNRIFMQSHPFSNGDKVVYYGSGFTGLTATATNYTVKPTIYYIRNKSTHEFSVSLTPTGSPVDITAVPTADQTAFFAYIVENPFFDCFYVPSHGLSTNDQLAYRVPAGTAIGGLTNATTYNVLKVDNDHFRVATTAAPTVYLKLTNFGATQSHGFTANAFANPYRDSVTVNNHELVTGTSYLLYNVNGNSAIGGYTDQQTSFVRVLDANRFQLFDTLANATAASTVFTGIRDITAVGTGTHLFTDISPTGTTDGVYTATSSGSLTFGAPSTATIAANEQTFVPNGVVDLTNSGFVLPNHRYTTGTKITYSVVSGTGITGLTNSTDYYVIRVTPNYIKLASSYENAIAGINVSVTYAAHTGLVQFIAPSIFGEIQGSGQIAYVYNSKTFDGATAVNLTTEAITITTHGFITGDFIQYSNGGGTTVGGLVNGSTYYIRAIDANTVSLYNSYNNAINSTIFPARGRIDLTAVGAGASHSFSSVNKFITGTGTLFTKQFKVGDTIVINNGESTATFTQATPDLTNFAADGTITSTAHSLTGANDGQPIYVTTAGTLPTGATTNGETFQPNRIYYFKFISATTFALYTTYDSALTGDLAYQLRYTVAGTGTVTFARRLYNQSLVTTISGILNDTRINVTNPPTASFSTTNYYIPTAVYVRPNAKALHRPYDGGVDLNPGLIPLASAARQTRRYFRYQSGKGVQISMAVNFNSPININNVSTEQVGADYFAIVETRYPHNLTDTLDVRMSGLSDSILNGTFPISSITDDYTFKYQLPSAPTSVGSRVGGDMLCNVVSWTGSSIRAGQFDDQNGFFYEYDGSTLYAVRRTTTQKLSGVGAVIFNSRIVNGTDTVFTDEIVAGDYVVIRGQSHRVISVESDTQIIISPAYRGVTASNVVMTKTVDEKVSQDNFSIDTVDGNGPSGYSINIDKIQMIYMDYSWYGAGKIRFGIKDDQGEVIYIHEFKHNNIKTQAYIRSGNLPGRYEVINGATLDYAPTLSHWGTSIIMDGGFDDDEAYFFSVGSDNISIPTAGVQYPLISLRLSPSVDSGLTGNLGDKEIINRMQLKGSRVTIVSTATAIVQILLNGKPSVVNYDFAGTPSLAQYIAHTGGVTPDVVSNGIVVAETRVAANALSEIDLAGLLPLGNSIIGGDGVFPNGPDLLTVSLIPLTTAASTASARISWTESQA